MIDDDDDDDDVVGDWIVAIFEVLVISISLIFATGDTAWSNLTFLFNLLFRVFLRLTALSSSANKSKREGLIVDSSELTWISESKIFLRCLDLWAADEYSTLSGGDRNTLFLSPDGLGDWKFILSIENYIHPNLDWDYSIVNNSTCSQSLSN